LAVAHQQVMVHLVFLLELLLLAEAVGDSIPNLLCLEHLGKVTTAAHQVMAEAEAEVLVVLAYRLLEVLTMVAVEELVSHHLFQAHKFNTLVVVQAEFIVVITLYHLVLLVVVMVVDIMFRQHRV
jgi:hypothetical protein